MLAPASSSPASLARSSSSASTASTAASVLVVGFQPASRCAASEDARGPRTGTPLWAFPSAAPGAALDRAGASVADAWVDDSDESDVELSDAESDASDASDRSAGSAAAAGGSRAQPLAVPLTMSQQRNRQLRADERRAVCAHLNAVFARPRGAGRR
ncbi:hypothetical protein HK105_208381 [Polyrhizophydium stewartii]|uniref:Uncharacterized protein n=1 Tax=Polyrhizophydium stewartii TaxID=2732419 RepID=A0ABR4MXU8_9FUNG|nr:hypothetical protein HK105_003414 [Polyrhizophydium stewartii]